MIISASYKTDIPAFYGTWFMNRLDAGFCRVVNPYGGPPFTVSLRPAEADGFVFWTRNLRPFTAALEEISSRSYPFVVQMTITGYPRALERSTVDPAAAVCDLRQIAQAFGTRAAVWRYDPIVITSLTPAAWHRDRFAALAGALAGSVDEVVVSFVHLYRKTTANLGRAARESGFEWRDPAAAEKRALIQDLAAIADDHAIALTVCGQPELTGGPITQSRCIDAIRLGEVAERPLRARARAQRGTCACWESKDIGAYDSCPQGCVYCYAVRRPDIAGRRVRAHHPAGEFLIAPDARKDAVASVPARAGPLGTAV
ncbi:MAG: DUF1848 domain-containing protein [Rhodospirillales bacterium]|nr:DUF1848 domain-containing protein [Rhodospirillales bacterium]